MHKYKNFYLKSFLTISIFFLLSGMMVSSVFSSSPDVETDYIHLVNLISEDSLEAPLYPFGDFYPDYDETNHRANLAYFKNNPEIIRKIRQDLNGGQIRWKLEEQKQRLLFVPEKRDKYERLYKTYCKELVSHILEQTNQVNPYKMIVSLHEEKPEIPSEGVTAFIIHNLARESVTRYSFSSDMSDKTSVMQLRGTDFVGEVGSFTTNIYPKSDGTFEFVRDTFTIWQNNAKNPYTALMVPAEETLHILLREHTERAIHKDLLQAGPLDIKNIQVIADKWLAVEEAIVGGLVRAIVPPFIKQFTEDFSMANIDNDLNTKKEYEKYCYLCQGIELVEQVGIHEAIGMYARSPLNFKNALAAYSTQSPEISNTNIKTN